MTCEDILRDKIALVRMTAGKRTAERLEKAYRNFAKTSTGPIDFENFKAGFLSALKNNNNNNNRSTNYVGKTK